MTQKFQLVQFMFLFYSFLTIFLSALAGVAQWIERCPASGGVPSSVPLGHMPGLQARSPVGGA